MFNNNDQKKPQQQNIDIPLSNRQQQYYERLLSYQDPLQFSMKTEAIPSFLMQLILTTFFIYIYI
jgi:hypothetical protein